MIFLPPTISRFLLRHYALWLVLVTLCCVSIIFAANFAERLRFVERFDQPSSLAVPLALMRLPAALVETLPFICLFATMICLRRLSRSSELIVIRAAGVSVWQFLAPLILASLALGAVAVGIIDPLGTYGLRREQAIRAAIGPLAQNISVAQTGVWLREPTAQGETILRAASITTDENGAPILHDAMFLFFTRNGRAMGRLDAPRARLVDAHWQIARAHSRDGSGDGRAVRDITLPTTISAQDLQQHFTSERVLSIWSLPTYIAKARSVGAPANAHRLRLHNLLSLPAVMAVMVLIGAIFSLPTGRVVAAARPIALAILAGFFFYLTRGFVGKLSLTSPLPMSLIVWSPIIIAAACSIALLLTTEDG